jgi:MarR family transcriptional regulator, organic hydroperoxide resistance regulator
MVTRAETGNTSLRRREIRQIVSSIRLIKDVHQRYSWELTKKYRMTGQQAGALMIIARYPDISLGELGERMYLHISTCSGIVDRLEGKGYVTRLRSSEDRRVVRLSVTASGRQMVKRVPISGFGTLLKGIESMPANEIHHISEAMRILLRVMKIERTERKETSHGR